MKALFQNALSIKNKLTLIILIINLVLLVLVGSILLATERIQLQETLKQDLISLADMVATNSNVGLSFLDAGAVNEVLRSLRARPNITMAHVFTRDGKPFGQYYRTDVPVLNQLQHIKDLDQAHLIQYTTENEAPKVIKNFSFHPRQAYAYSVKLIYHDNLFLGSLLIQADLGEFYQRLFWYSVSMLGVMGLGLLIATLLGRSLQGTITEPVFHIRDTMKAVSLHEDYSLRAEKRSADELGELIDGFNNMLCGIEKRDQEILSLNRRLHEENRRMGAELEVTRKIQQMVLPKPSELQAIKELDIAGYMLPADEVGGDYYDVLHHDGRIKIGIGDVTGHGLESGVVMLMVQTAVRTLLMNNVTDAESFIQVVNSTIFGNVQRMASDKNLTLSLLDYQQGRLRFTGQHEDILIARTGGRIECIDTCDYGFMIGLVPDIQEFVACSDVYLNIGDSLVLYTDGITEARNMRNELYGVQRLSDVVAQYWQASATDIQDAVINDVHHFAGEKAFIDDITLLIIKRVS